MSGITIIAILLSGILYPNTGAASVLYSFDGNISDIHVHWEYIAPALLAPETSNRVSGADLLNVDSTFPIARVAIGTGGPFFVPFTQTDFQGSPDIESITWGFPEATQGFNQLGTYQTVDATMVISDVPEPPEILLISCASAILLALANRSPLQSQVCGIHREEQSKRRASISLQIQWRRVVPCTKFFSV